MFGSRLRSTKTHCGPALNKPLWWVPPALGTHNVLPHGAIGPCWSPCTGQVFLRGTTRPQRKQKFQNTQRRHTKQTPSGPACALHCSISHSQRLRESKRDCGCSRGTAASNAPVSICRIFLDTRRGCCGFWESWHLRSSSVKNTWGPEQGPETIFHWPAIFEGGSSPPRNTGVSNAARLRRP